MITAKILIIQFVVHSNTEGPGASRQAFGLREALEFFLSIYLPISWHPGLYHPSGPLQPPSSEAPRLSNVPLPPEL